MEAIIQQKKYSRNGYGVNYIHRIERRDKIQEIFSNVFSAVLCIIFPIIVVTCHYVNNVGESTIGVTYSPDPQIITGDFDLGISSLDPDGYIDSFAETLNTTSYEESSVIYSNDTTLVKKDLPDVYYQGLDFSSFQPFMGYAKITDATSPAYGICHSDNAYTDEHGFRRYKTDETQFTINGEDDYMVALGTYYKEPGTVGSRFLVVTSTGMFTIITGSEKADVDTDPMNMYSIHGDGELGGIIEWIVDEKHLDRTIKGYGTVTKGPVLAMQGTILALYEIR